MGVSRVQGGGVGLLVQGERGKSGRWVEEGTWYKGAEHGRSSESRAGIVDLEAESRLRVKTIKKRLRVCAHISHP